MPLTQESPRPVHRPVAAYIAAGLLLIGLAGGALWAASQVVMVPSAVPPSMAVAEEGQRNGLSANAHSQLRLSASGPSWKDINNTQRQILMPLRDRWESMGALAKRRWLVLADRYPSMDEAERTKLLTRMHTWAGLSAQQRNQARLNFESAKRLSPKELQSKWEEYRALSEAEKARLAEQARKSKALAAKKAKRRLARIPAPKAEPVPKQVSPSTPGAQGSPAAPLPAAPTHTPMPSVTPSHGAAHTAEPAAPTASSQPITVPQSMPMVELAPLPAAAPPAPVETPPMAPPPAR